MTEELPTVLFSEPGATWRWLLIGPIVGGLMAYMQITTGYGLDVTVPAIFFVLTTSFLAVQVKAARLHTSIELTSEYLRQGVETILVNEIVEVFPPETGAKSSTWQSARALGELAGVPRRRTGIGLRLTSDRTAQAWARRHREMRSVLNSLVNERQP